MTNNKFELPDQIKPKKGRLIAKGRRGGTFEIRFVKSEMVDD